jgi:hypothetical protein
MVFLGSFCLLGRNILSLSLLDHDRKINKSANLRMANNYCAFALIISRFSIPEGCILYYLKNSLKQVAGQAKSFYALFHQNQSNGFGVMR